MLTIQNGLHFMSVFSKKQTTYYIVRDVQKADFQTLDQIMTIANGFRRYGTPPKFST